MIKIGNSQEFAGADCIHKANGKNLFTVAGAMADFANSSQQENVGGFCENITATY